MAKSLALTLAGAAVFALSSAALAADLLPAAPPLEPLPPTSSGDFSSWYLRGDLGVGVATAPGFTTGPDALATGLASGFLSANANEGYFNASMSESMIGDFGFGYRFNSIFRMDVTGELRGGASFQGLEVVNDSTHGPVPTTSNQWADFYRANVSSYLGMVNAYTDIGTWSGVTPYVGAGLGVAFNRISGASDIGSAAQAGGPTSATGGYIDSAGGFNLAWALMAGLDFNVTHNLKLELGYRYINYGSVTSGYAHCLTGNPAGQGAFSCTPAYSLTVNKLASNDFRLGLIWTLDPGPSEYAPQMQPLIRKY